MNRTVATAVAAAALLLGLTSCSSGKTGTAAATPRSSAKSGASASPSAVGEPLTAASAFTGISRAVPAVKLSGTVTAEDDPNDLLGRPHQYTSKVTFSDSRISADDVSGTEKDGVERGGSIEVFATAADAKTRATYIQDVTKGMPALTEYDYVNGTVLVRVSHYLTPEQAAEYKSAVDALG
ncbi:hypothetical protein [Streptomyces sp. NPDC002580]|uniref:hypothetical protein n=1 Tax=Streptomyces sp. NPDC002580 TaxID=3364653 RepID=UPI00367DF253